MKFSTSASFFSGWITVVLVDYVLISVRDGWGIW